jgi:hypothetical protein
MVVVLRMRGRDWVRTLHLVSQNTAISGISYAGFDGAGGGAAEAYVFFVNEEILLSWTGNAVIESYRFVSEIWRRSLTV